MDEFEIDDSLDTSFSDDSSIDSYESSGDALEAMETAEVPTIEDASFDSVESENIEDYSYEDTEPFNDEVNDVMNSVEVEELTFDDEPIVDVQSVETLEVETERPLEEQSAPDLVEAMNDVEPEALEFDEQVEEVYEAKPNSEQQIILEDGSIDTIENIQANLEAEVEQIEQPVEPYEAKPNSEQQIILEDGSVDTIENIQANLEAETEQIEQPVESYEAKPNSEQQIILEDGSVDTIENIQANLEAEAEQIEQPVEPYEAKPNSEQQIILEDGSIDTIENIQANLEAEAEQAIEQYETMSDSEMEMLQEDGAVDAFENIQEQLNPHEALSNMSEYMNAHNYGMEDYETYSKDPEWQALNRDLQMANGIEPTEYVEEMPDTMELAEQLDPHEALSNMSEYMNAHNYGMEDYETYSKDPEWQALNRDLQIANGVESTEQITEELQEVGTEIVQRQFDDFEQSVLERNPEFYETGSYYEQGVNEFGYQGTCGPTSQANAINQLLGTNELTENKVLSVAIDNNLCQTHGALDSCGGTSTEQFMELYNKMNEQLGDRFETELFEYDNVLDANQVAERLENGDVINVAVDACALWDQPRNYTNAFGVRQDDFYSDHWITVTGVERMEDGSIRGFDIIDSGGGESYVSLDKYNDMCFGTDEHRVIDPTCIVLSRKEGVEQCSLENIPDNINLLPESSTNVEINKRPSLFDRIFRRKGE